MKRFCGDLKMTKDVCTDTGQKRTDYVRTDEHLHHYLKADHKTP